MKKKILIIGIIILLLLVGVLAFIKFNNQSFIGYSFERQTDVDTESIYFGKDNSFGYSEIGAGNPVGDFDLCETYKYNKSKNEIKINCDEYTKFNIKKIKVVSYKNGKLVLDFNGEKKTFNKVKD